MARLLALSLLLLSVVPLAAQVAPSEQVQVGPPPVRRVELPSPTASAEDLEKQGDNLRSDKDFTDAMEYYHAALKKKKNDAVLLNKIGISELLMLRLSDARKSFNSSIKANRLYPEARNNLGVVYYSQRKYKKAIKEYSKAIKLRPDAASYYSNLGAAYFARRKFDKASAAYGQAMALDPDIFERVSRSGISAYLASPADRAHYDYVIAGLYAKAGDSDRALEYLERAMEEGYKNIKDVYKDQEFTEIRKDPRFVKLMADRPPAIPE
jgi:tetratricopeptide (TPR) repeat protein